MSSVLMVMFRHLNHFVNPISSSRTPTSCPPLKWGLHTNRLVYIFDKQHINSPGPFEQNEPSCLPVTPLGLLLWWSDQHESIKVNILGVDLWHLWSQKDYWHGLIWVKLEENLCWVNLCCFILFCLLDMRLLWAHTSCHFHRKPQRLHWLVVLLFCNGLFSLTRM